MQDINYWYFGQIKKVILHALRIFSNFKVSDGIDKDGKLVLRRVPVTYMSTDKSAMSMILKNSDTVIESSPRMILSIQRLKLNNEYISGAPYEELETFITEKKFNEETGDYSYETGNSYNISRLNPLPLGFDFKLFICTTMQDQKCQLFEQIRAVFSPTLELQTSENPLDWSRITSINLTDCNWSSKGSQNLDATQLDVMDLTFQVDTNLDMPSLVQKQAVIEQIRVSISEGNGIEDIMEWNFEDVTRTFYTPTNCCVETFYDNGQRIKIIPNEKCKNWYDLCRIYGLTYNQENSDIKIHCISTANPERTVKFSGLITINPSNPTEATYIINQEDLPQTNIDSVQSIINPHTFVPVNVEGTRYLLDEELPDGTTLYGELIGLDGNPKNGVAIQGGCIIEYKNGKWTEVLNPTLIHGIYFLRDDSAPQYLYTYNNDVGYWVDEINKKYNIEFWRVSEKTNK